MSLNRVMLIGYLGQDPEIRYTPTGMPVVNFSVATDEAYIDQAGERQRRPERHRVVAVGKLALTCKEYLKSGRQLFVEGRLRTREWESNRVNGRRTEIVATRVQFLGAPPGDVKVAEPSAEAGLVAKGDVRSGREVRASIGSPCLSAQRR
jgi:single-strand DNA-binding protein